VDLPDDVGTDLAGEVRTRRRPRRGAGPSASARQAASSRIGSASGMSVREFARSTLPPVRAGLSGTFVGNDSRGKDRAALCSSCDTTGAQIWRSESSKDRSAQDSVCASSPSAESCGGRDLRRHDGAPTQRGIGSVGRRWDHPSSGPRTYQPTRRTELASWIRTRVERNWPAGFAPAAIDPVVAAVLAMPLTHHGPTLRTSRSVDVLVAS
jgi:hypothetical protein